MNKVVNWVFNTRKGLRVVGFLLLAVGGINYIATTGTGFMPMNVSIYGLFTLVTGMLLGRATAIK